VAELGEEAASERHLDIARGASGPISWLLPPASAESHVLTEHELDLLHAVKMLC
jgi:hypothetical protein